MRRDKHGHAWKRQDGTARRFCPFCGLEGKPLPGTCTMAHRRIGSGAKWSREVPRCKRIVLGKRIVWRRHAVTVFSVALRWPPRFECVDGAGRKVTVPAMAYWRARRAG